MKKIMITALALSLAAPAAALAKADDDGRWERRRDRYEQRLERRQDRFERRLERRADRGYHHRYGYNHGYRHYDRPTVYYAPPVRHYYYAPAPTYRYYAPPPAYGYGHGYGYGYAPRWHQGQVLPHHYRRYVVHNYHDYGWGRPPYGHAYYRTDGGDIVLAAIATGLILSVFAGAF